MTKLSIGDLYKLEYNKNHIDNGVIEIREIVDDNYIVYKYISYENSKILRSKGIYRMQPLEFFKWMLDDKNLIKIE